MNAWPSHPARPDPNAPATRRLEPGELRAGEPVPFDLFDDRGRRMLLEGAVPADADGLERMVGRGLYCDAARYAQLHPPVDAQPAIVLPRVARVRPWRLLHALRDTLEPALATLAGEGAQAPDGGAAALHAVQAAGAELQRLCALDPDAMLAVPLLLRGGRHGTRHVLGAAIVVETLLARLGATVDERRAAVSAALTMNLGMFAMLETLHSHEGPLSPAQREDMLAHPQAGVALLRAAGVDDPLWLAIVGQHHEHLDGTGYPRRIAGAALHRDAQALMVADRWCALVGERGYRSGAPPDQALQWLCGKLDGQADAAIGRALREAVGPMPPGTPVRLVGGELGIVFRRSRDPAAPVVSVFRSAIGATLPDGVRRATGEPRLRIEGCARLGELGCEIDPERIWEAAEVLEPTHAGA